MLGRFRNTAFCGVVRPGVTSMDAMRLTVAPTAQVNNFAGRSVMDTWSGDFSKLYPKMACRSAFEDCQARRSQLDII